MKSRYKIFSILTLVFYSLTFVLPLQKSAFAYVKNENAEVFLGKPSEQPKNLVLNCHQSRRLIATFLDLHLVYHSFTSEISKRTLKTIFRVLDPGKYYFTEGDVQQFNSLSEKIPDLLQQNNCTFMADIYAVFKNRVDERQTVIMNFIEKPIDFSIDESMIIDRSKMPWAKDSSELNERWRQRIKFQILNLKETDVATKDSKSDKVTAVKPKENEGLVKAKKILTKRYKQLKKYMDEQNSDYVLSVLLNAFALSLDPHSTFMLPIEQEEFSTALGNQFEGIGAVLKEDDGYVTIAEIIPGGAAHKDGRLRVKDKIVLVDSGDGSGVQDVIDMDLTKTVRLIRGKKGSTVTLTILRENDEPGKKDRLVITLKRDVVHLTATIAKSDVMKAGDKKIGVIQLPMFYTDFKCRSELKFDCSGATAHVAKELDKLKKQHVDGIILDLRNNPGGDLSEGVGIGNLFIPEKTIVQVMDKKRKPKSLQDPGIKLSYRGPLAVLINKQSASASEIVAGAIQDYGRGLILGGSHTYGKGTVQLVQDIPGSHNRNSDGAFKITQSKFYRPSGMSNQERGVESDIVIPDLLDQMEFSEKENDYALPWDAIGAAPDFATFAKHDKLLPKLKEFSSTRIKNSVEFKSLQEKMRTLKTENDKNTVSLMDEAFKKVKSKNNNKNPDKEKTKNSDGLDSLGDKKVIRSDDIQLTEAAAILGDAIKLKNTQNWVP